MAQKTLLIRNLPHSLSDKQVVDLLKHFGAESVRYMGKHGRMKHTAFATFKTESLASENLRLLHQLNVLNFLLKVEYARENDVSEGLNSKRADLDEKHSSGKANSSNTSIGQVENGAHSSNTNPRLNKHGGKSRVPAEAFVSKLNHLSKQWNVEYSIDQSYSYSYPPPTNTTLQNIVHCMASVPKFYNQVLHLMNKMNLPPPFGELTTTPPLPAAKTFISGDKKVSSSEESEMESSDEENKNKRKKPKSASNKSGKKRVMPELPTEIYAKRLKLKLGIPAAPAVNDNTLEQKAMPSSTIQDVFEVAREQAKQAIQSKLNLPSHLSMTSSQQDNQIPSESTGTFGQIGSSNVTTSDGLQDLTTKSTAEGPDVIEPGYGDDTEHKTNEQEEKEGSTPYITARELSEGRVPEEERPTHPVLKKYIAGEPCERLYVKNLAKQTTEADIKYIFGRYVDWNDPQEVELFHIRHMTEGRMKGQAFITLPTLEAAEIAVSECHAYRLYDKPISVSYAKSKS